MRQMNAGFRGRKNRWAFQNSVNQPERQLAIVNTEIWLETLQSSTTTVSVSPSTSARHEKCCPRQWGIIDGRCCQHPQQETSFPLSFL